MLRPVSIRVYAPCKRDPQGWEQSGLKDGAGWLMRLWHFRFPVDRSLGKVGRNSDASGSLLAEAASRGKHLLLPKDHIVADKFDASAAAETAPTRAIPADRIGLDIGPATRAEYAAEIAKAKTIVWNGPMGVFEMAQFAEGTLAIARAVAASSAISIVGGGDSVAAVKKMGVADKVSHISTGGGASLEFLSGLTLPGVAALTEKK